MKAMHSPADAGACTHGCELWWYHLIHADGLRVRHSRPVDRVSGPCESFEFPADFSASARLYNHAHSLSMFTSALRCLRVTCADVTS